MVLVQSSFRRSGAARQLAAAQALGSGFVVDTDGTILTNAHVVMENGVKASSVTVAVPPGDRTRPAARSRPRSLGVDPTSDVAVLRVDPPGHTLTPLPLGDSNKVGIGQWVVAIGNPLGYDFSLTQGIVSGLGRDLQAPNGAMIPNGIQTDAAINQGNSGGPLLDQNGNVIGINEQIASPSGSFSGLGFAIPIDYGQVGHAADHDHRDGQARVPRHRGADDHPAAGQGARASRRTQGVLVVSVQQGTAAAAAGIKGGTQTRVIQGAAAPRPAATSSPSSTVSR